MFPNETFVRLCVSKRSVSLPRFEPTSPEDYQGNTFATMPSEGECCTPTGDQMASEPEVDPKSLRS